MLFAPKKFNLSSSPKLLIDTSKISFVHSVKYLRLHVNSSSVRRKFPRGEGKVSSQSCDVTNQLGECRRHDHYRVVRGHAPKKFCKITPKNTHFRAFWKQVLV